MTKKQDSNQPQLFEDKDYVNEKKLGLLPPIHKKLFYNDDQSLKLSLEETYSWLNYIYAKPTNLETTNRLNLKNRIIGLYDPFADQDEFPSGRRWCVNVYTGCSFSCKYCYTISYIAEAFHPRVKKDFEKKLKKDLKDIKEFSLHPAPIHISNSTDPLQPLEKVHKHTLLLLSELKKNRELFTTITILTKNPAILCGSDYINVIKSLSTKDHFFQVEVTCPFYNDDTRRFFEPGAPPVQSRLDAIRQLREQGIRVALRIDPIFPRDPLPKDFFEKPSLKDYGAPQSQTDEDFEQLIRFASDVKCSRIIISPLKLTTDRLNKSELIPVYLKLFAAANKGRAIKKGAAFRLPWELYCYWREKPLQVADSLGMPLIYCKKNLIETY